MAIKQYRHSLILVRRMVVGVGSSPAASHVCSLLDIRKGSMKLEDEVSNLKQRVADLERCRWYQRIDPKVLEICAWVTCVVVVGLTIVFSIYILKTC